MKYFSTFSGIGGFEIGINKAYEELQNIFQSKELQHETKDSAKLGQSRVDIKPTVRLGNPKCVGYSEINKYAIQIYQKHFNHKNYGDITIINAKELPDFDLLVGGFPCQAFSIAGKRMGFDDTRGTLFFDIARILKEKRPRNFVLENVKGLLSHDNGNTFKTIITTLVELGYCVEWQVLNAKNFGVPQNRERVFIVGHLGGIPKRKVFPITGTVRQNISQLNTPKHSNDRIYGTDGISPTLNTMQGGNRQPFIANTLDANYAKGNSGSSKRHTPRTQIEKGTRIRRLTPLECERLMSYPDFFTEKGIDIKGNEVLISDTQRYRVLGNGIISNVVEEIVKKLSIN